MRASTSASSAFQEAADQLGHLGAVYDLKLVVVDRQKESSRVICRTHNSGKGRHLWLEITGGSSREAIGGIQRFGVKQKRQHQPAWVMLRLTNVEALLNALRRELR